MSDREVSYGEKMMIDAIAKKDWLDAERKAKAEEEQRIKEETEAKDRANRQKWDKQDHLVDVLEQGKPSEERQKFIEEKSKNLREKIASKAPQEEPEQAVEEKPAKRTRRQVFKKQKEYV